MANEYILCVDDDAVVLYGIADELNREFGREFDIVSAMTAMEALEIIDERARAGSSLALLVSDQNMPGMKGAELLLRVRERDPEAELILQTGEKLSRERVLGLNEAGLFRLLLKPWSSTALRGAGRQAIEARKRRRGYRTPHESGQGAITGSISIL
jgi:DNA-binding NtrC family response regulator